MFALVDKLLEAAKFVEMREQDRQQQRQQTIATPPDSPVTTGGGHYLIHSSSNNLPGKLPFFYVLVDNSPPTPLY